MLGQNITYRIERYTYNSDDQVGGVSVTGTVVHEGIAGRIQGSIPNENLFSLNQGLETLREFRVTTLGNRDIREGSDHFYITDPVDHPYYLQEMTINKVVYSNFIPSDPRFYMILTVTRSVESHTIQ